MVRISESESQDSDDELYEVEKIVAKRKRQGKVEFLIKWRGYKSDENSWEPEEHLVGCSNMIREYNKNEKEIITSFSKTRQSRVNGQLKKSPEPKSIGSLDDDLAKYRILHQISSPPVSSYLGKRTKHSEMKPTREEKPPIKDNTSVTNKKSILKILAAITLFILLILALVQPVGIRSKISGTVNT
ncbi:Hypothetical predicted protein [Paramuricea clavata]|uniref:Uncharacterized protein n=1 Tax=Paramuricea clavata TaxID=317549 RepID=A0A7D9E948_PARCT|nr:Hypothetical predicted protein [Paramuricea clavata]